MGFLAVPSCPVLASRAELLRILAFANEAKWDIFMKVYATTSDSAIWVPAVGEGYVIVTTWNFELLC